MWALVTSITFLLTLVQPHKSGSSFLVAVLLILMRCYCNNRINRGRVWAIRDRFRPRARFETRFFAEVVS